jgi:hypothetical protein
MGKQSSCGVALTLLKTLVTGASKCFGAVKLKGLYQHRQQKQTPRTWPNTN